MSSSSCRALRPLLLALAALALGCSEKPSPSPAPAQGGSTAPSDTEHLSPPRASVKVPVPPGWVANVASDDSLQAGPPGRPVLRVDRRRGEGAQLPSPEALADTVREQFSEFALSLDQEEGNEEVALVRITLAPKLEDGGLGPHGAALLGAKRIAEDLFLCATLPGASPEEVRLATEACRDIQLQSSPQ